MFGNRSREAGANALMIMRWGHPNVTVSQKHVHPAAEGMERALGRLEALNRKTVASVAENEKRQRPATSANSRGGTFRNALRAHSSVG